METGLSLLLLGAHTPCVHQISTSHFVVCIGGVGLCVRTCTDIGVCIGGVGLCVRTCTDIGVCIGGVGTCVKYMYTVYMILVCALVGCVCV